VYKFIYLLSYFLAYLLLTEELFPVERRCTWLICRGQVLHGDRCPATWRIAEAYHQTPQLCRSTLPMCCRWSTTNIRSVIAHKRIDEPAGSILLQKNSVVPPRALYTTSSLQQLPQHNFFSGVCTAGKRGLCPQNFGGSLDWLHFTCT